MMQAAPKRRPRKLQLAMMACPVVIIAIALAIGSIPQGPLVITPPLENAEAGRWVHIEGAANTRDTGGCRKRPTMLCVTARNAGLGRIG